MFSHFYMTHIEKCSSVIGTAVNETQPNYLGKAVGKKEFCQTSEHDFLRLSVWLWNIPQEKAARYVWLLFPQNGNGTYELYFCNSHPSKSANPVKQT
jgi:hypothetical protein